MVQINWTADAKQWLQESHAYIARDNPAAAERVVLGIYDKAQLLTAFPEIGYRYRKDSTQIDILGVFHGAMKMDRYLP